MKRKFTDRWAAQREWLGNRLRNGRQKRFYRCPGCRRIQSIPVAKGQNKLTCRHCGEIFLRRI